MKKNLALFALTLGICTVLTANSVKAADFSVAIVDVPQVVNASAQVQELKKEQQAKGEEIVKFVEKGRKEVAEITDANKKKAAVEKLTKELEAKKAKMDKEYATKLQAIDASISKQIETQAKAQGYDIVLSKGVVLYGGKDITAEIIKVVK